jgi:methylase of polypeptide subunit release factors
MHTPPKSTPTLDLFSGSGCIALSLAPSCRKTLGIDLSPTAIALARRNLSRNAATLGTVDVCFSVGDVTDVDATVALAEVHDAGGGLVVANPPYVSCDGFDRETERSVRIFEPRDALVPPGGDGDWVYPMIVEVAERVGAMGLVVEVGGWEQAGRVRKGLVERGASGGGWRFGRILRGLGELWLLGGWVGSGFGRGLMRGGLEGKMYLNVS